MYQLYHIFYHVGSHLDTKNDSCLVFRYGNALHPQTRARHILSSADYHPIRLESQAKCKEPWEIDYCAPIMTVHIFLQSTYISNTNHIPIWYVLLASTSYIWQMGRSTKGIIFREFGTARCCKIFSDYKTSKNTCAIGEQKHWMNHPIMFGLKSKQGPSLKQTARTWKHHGIVKGIEQAGASC